MAQTQEQPLWMCPLDLSCGRFAEKPHLAKPSGSIVCMPKAPSGMPEWSPAPLSCLSQPLLANPSHKTSLEKVPQAEKGVGALLRFLSCLSWRMGTCNAGLQECYYFFFPCFFLTQEILKCLRATGFSPAAPPRGIPICEAGNN